MQYNLEVIMRNRWKKTAAAAVAGCLAAGVLAGCGTKHIDPEKYATTVVATVGDQKIYLDEANYMPVSYTHLDVYKRQVEKRTVPGGAALRLQAESGTYGPESSGL